MKKLLAVLVLVLALFIAALPVEAKVGNACGRGRAWQHNKHCAPTATPVPTFAPKPTFAPPPTPMMTLIPCRMQPIPMSDPGSGGGDGWVWCP